MMQPTRNFLVRTPSATVAAAVVRLAAAYVLLGGMAKRFFGTPGGLPKPLRDLMYWNEQGLFTLVIAVEVLVAVTALVSPRIGWPAVAALLLGFMAVLVDQVAHGATNCGCFGAMVEAPPGVMLAVDLGLLLALGWSRPWGALRSVPWRWWGLAPAVIVAVLAVATLNRQVEVVQDDGSSAGDRSTTNPPPANGGGDNDTGAAPTQPGNNPPGASSGWRLPDRFPRYVVLRPSAWIGQPISETVLATWADTSRFPQDATVIFYMDTCRHCAAHLQAAADNPANTEYVLIRLPVPRESTLPTLVDAKPPGLAVDLPRGTLWDMRVPWEMTIRGGIVSEARYLGE